MYNFYKENMVHLPPRSRIHQILRIMKLTTLILITVILHVSAATMAQKVTLVEKNAQLVDVFQQIHKQTGYDFLFTGSDLKNAKPVTINVKNEELADVLSKIFEAQSMDFTIENNTILIKPKETNFFDNLKNKVKAEFAQVTVSGKVQNELGEPMVGVTVRIKDSQEATVTDKNGVFAISTINNEITLVFSYIGYETVELRAKDIVSGGIITLKATETNLHEVVVNKGYYSERQELSTGNVGRVTAKQIENEPIANPLQALQGTVPGVIVTQTTGAPGGGFTVQIRGLNSINNGVQPFYVIDGVPYDSKLPSVQGSTLLNPTLRQGSPLNFINPYDIESIEVLKDADATAIYGSRAANGAILITTKKGKPGAMQVSATINSGFTSLTRSVQLMNTQQYLAMRHEAFKNDGAAIAQGNGDYDIDGTWDTTRYTNLQKTLAQNPAPYLNTQASVSGGNTNTQYLIGADLYRQSTPFPPAVKGATPGGDDQRASVHFSINSSSANNKLNVALTGSYVSDINTVQPIDFYNSTLTALPPDVPPLYNADGSLNWAPLVPGQAGTWPSGNPLAQTYITDRALTTNLQAHSVITYQLLPGLNIKTNLGYGNSQTNEIKAVPIISYDPGYHITTGQSTFNALNSSTWIIEPQLNYGFQLGKGHVTTLLGATWNKNSSGAQELNATGFSSDALLQNIQAATSVTATSISSQYKYEAVYFRANYDLNDKYVVNLTARRDGSSRFGPGKQFADFGAIGAAWIFSKEKWIAEQLPVLSFGKLRASYGTTGSDQVGDYRYLNLYSITTYPYNGTQGLYPTSLFNPDLAWERTNKLEFGIDLGFLNNRLNFEASYYRNRSDNQLVNTPVSSVTGFITLPANLPALVQNNGFEWVLNTVNVKTKDVSWTSSFNWSANRNKLIAFPNLSTSPYKSQFVIGQPINIKKVFHNLGVDPATGIYQFQSSTGPTSTPVSNIDNNTLIDIAPKFSGGFQNNMQYKSLSLSFLFQFVKQTGININGLSNGIMPGLQLNQPVAFLNRWQKPGDQAPYERFSQTGGAAYTAFNNVTLSDFIYSDASFIRLKNVNLSYELPDQWKRYLRMKNCKIFMQGQNLLTFTNYIGGIDPESQSWGLPPMRIWTMGINATF